MSRIALGISSGSFYPHPRRVELAFQYAAHCELDGVEVILDPQQQIHQQGNLEKIRDRHDVSVLSLHAPFPPWRLDGWRPGAAAYIEQTVDLAERVGARHVVMHVPERFYLRKIRFLGRRIRVPFHSRHGREIERWIRTGGLARLQDRTPVKICVENFPNPFAWLPNRLFARRNTLSAWPQIHSFLTLDTTHWATHGIELLRAYRAGGDRIRHIHLSNYTNRRQHQLPQTGELDLEGFMKRLTRDNFGGVMIIEVRGEALGIDEPDMLDRKVEATVAFCRSALEILTQ